MFETATKKFFSVMVSLTVALSFVVGCVCVYRTGIIPGINQEVDAKKEAIIEQEIRKKTVEGVFIDRSGLAITTATEPGVSATVNYSESFSYIVGYNSYRLGLSGLRKHLKSYLFDGGKDNVGATVQLTINASLQERLYPLLDGFVGSISIINAKTGEIVAMVSRGDGQVDYNVNNIDVIYEKGATPEDDKYYSDLYNTISEFYYNRAVFAQDPPGSTAKVVTAASQIENGKEDLIYNDVDGYYLDNRIHNYGYKAYGECDLKKALNNSVNTYFANSAIELGRIKVKNTFNNFMVGESIDLDFTTLNSTFSGNDHFTLASNAYGQGEVVVAPLHIAMWMGAILNNGEMMRPYLIEKITNDNKTVYKKDIETLSVATDKKSAKKLTELLVSNSEHYGFYDNFDRDDVTIIAKSGTAEVANESNGNHIYYAVGVEHEDVPYGICVDRTNFSGMSGVLAETVIDVIDILIDEVS